MIKKYCYYCGGVLPTRTVTCEQCGTVFQARRKTRKYCSKKCTSAAMRKRVGYIKHEPTRNCIECGEPCHGLRCLPCHLCGKTGRNKRAFKKYIEEKKKIYERLKQDEIL